MIVSCPKCKTKYKLDDSLLAAKGLVSEEQAPVGQTPEGLKLRCSRCKYEFFYPPEEGQDKATLQDEEPAGEVRKAEKDAEGLDQGEEAEQSAQADGVDDELTAQGMEREGQKNKDPGEGQTESKEEDLEGFLDGQVDLSLEKKTSFSLPGKWGIWLLLLVLFSGLGIGGYYFWPSLQERFPFLKSEEVKQKELLQKKAQWEEFAQEITLKNVRQYVVNNVKIGQVLVIEGEAMNKSNFPRELIKVRAEIYDAQGKVLASKELLCGNSVSLYQLQMFSEEELEKALTSKVGILTNNLNILPGQSTRFMLTFYNPPPSMVQFSVKVVQAKPVVPSK